MSRLPLTIATGDYDRVRPILNGCVGIEGCDVNYPDLADSGGMLIVSPCKSRMTLKRSSLHSAQHIGICRHTG